jgi:hypothetical protein
MLFKILKLFGLDVPAKVAAAKSVIEQRVEEVTGYAKQVTQTAAVVAALGRGCHCWMASRPPGSQCGMPKRRR